MKWRMSEQKDPSADAEELTADEHEVPFSSNGCFFPEGPRLSTKATVMKARREAQNDQ